MDWKFWKELATGGETFATPVMMVSILRLLLTRGRGLPGYDGKVDDRHHYFAVAVSLITGLAG